MKLLSKRPLPLALVGATLLLGWTRPAPVLAHGDIAEHIQIMTDQYQLQPSAELLVRRARAYIDQNNPRAARKDLQRALDLEPQRHEAWYWLASAELKLGQPARALEAIEKFLGAADSDTARASGLVIKGDALLAAGDPLAAAETYAGALRLEPDANPEHVLKAVDAFHAAKSGRWRSELDEGLRRLGPLVSLQERGYQYDMADGDYESALRRVGQMLASGLRRPQLLYKQALTYKALQRPEAARASLQAALHELEQLPAVRREIPALQQLRHDIERELAS